MKARRWSCLLLFFMLSVAPSLQQARDRLDLVFVVDSSDSVGAANFLTVRESIINYITPQMTGNLYVGFVQYATKLDEKINLTEDPALFAQSVRALTFVGGETKTDIGIQWGLSVLLTTSSQPGAPQEMIVIVDGVSRFPTETKSMSQFARDMSVAINAVGVGAGITPEELNNIAGDQSRVYFATDFATLPDIDLRVGAVSVTTAQPTIPTPRPTTPSPTTPRPTTPRPTTTQPTTPRTPAPTTPRITTPRVTTPRVTTPRVTQPPETPRPTSPRTPQPTTPRTVAPTTPRVTTLPPRPTPTTPRPVVTTRRTTTPSTTTTTRRAPTTPYIRPFLDEGLCESAKVIDGIGYRAHPTDADKYVQCYFPSTQRTLAVVRECPFGLLWNDRARYCDTYLRIRLSEDPCRSGDVRAHPHEGNCRTFYNCEGGRSVPRCCPPGYLFDAPSQGCSPCSACNDNCPAMCSTTRLACSKYPVFDDFSVYRKWTRDGDVIVPCANGTLFDITACACVDFKIPDVCTPDIEVPFRSVTGNAEVTDMKFDDVTINGNMGVFDGVKSRVRVKTGPVSAFDRPLVMRVTFREAAKIASPIALVSSSRCGFGGLVLVSLERGSIKIEMSSYGRTPIIFRLPTDGFKATDTKDVLFYHDRHHLTVVAMSGKLAYLRRAKVAVLPYLTCGLDFGHSEWMGGFNGTISRVQLLRCDPQDFKVY